MRSSMRLLNLEVSSLQGSRTRYVCSTCSHETRPRPLIARQFLRNASNKPQFTERVRRKIWGTDNPPGLEDPYGGEGVLERKFKKSEAARKEEAESQQPAEPVFAPEPEPEEIATAGEYKPALTWDGIAHIGHLGKWSDLPPSTADAYESFMLKKKLTKKEHLSLAAHQTAVELCLLHSLNLPLESISDVVEHEKPVFKMIWKCKINPNATSQWSESLVYPNKETQDALVYIFEQIGNRPALAAAAAAAAEEAEEIAAEDSVMEEAATEEIPAKEPVTEETFDEKNWENIDEFGKPLHQPFFGYADVRDRGFLTLPLNDLATKFAYLKRFSQLSGHYFPDPAVHSISTVAQVIQHVQTQLNPKPKKLGEQLVDSKILGRLPNVKVFAKRQKRSHNDDELGRKKLIEMELRSRGLI